MASRKPPNPNTSYGRKKLREEYYQHLANLTPEERAKENGNQALMYILILGFLALIIFLISGSEGLSKWLTH